MKGADAAASGQGATTIYRDKKGRKLDMLNEFMRQQNAREGKEVIGLDTQATVGSGYCCEYVPHFVESSSSKPSVRRVRKRIASSRKQTKKLCDDAGPVLSTLFCVCLPCSVVSACVWTAVHLQVRRH